MARKQDLDWAFGLRAASGKYLTVETFGHALKCAKSSMKKKEIFFLEKTEGVEAVKVRTHLGKYLTVDGDGIFKADGARSDPGSSWLIEAAEDGRWSFKSEQYGWYAGASNPEMTGRQCFEKCLDGIPDHKRFTVHLAMHPMVTIMNVKRTTFLHMNDEETQLSTDEIIPWGDDAVLTLHFNKDNGTYSVRSCRGTYLSHTGELAAERDESSGKQDYILEFHGGNVAFKNLFSQKYVTSLGTAGLAKATKSSVTKDELYQLQNSYPQITLRANNGKYWSIKQGVEIAASAASAETDKEIFQIEPLANGKWTMKAANPERALGLGVVDGGVHAANEGDQEFGIEFIGTKIAITTASGKYLSQAMNGYIKASADSVGDAESFEFRVVNRPRLVLRGAYGFVSTLPSGLLDSAFSDGEEYRLESVEGKGVAIVHGKSGKYVRVNDRNGLSVNGDEPEWFTIELFANSKCALKTAEGKYLQTAQNGGFSATGSEPSTYTLFEY